LTLFSQSHGTERIAHAFAVFDMEHLGVFRFFHGDLFSGDDDLARRVVICRGNYTIFGGVNASFFYGCIRS